MTEPATTSLSFATRVLAKLPGLALKWYYKEERLVKEVDVEVQARDQPLRINFDPGNEFLELKMRVWNVLPFEIELDRASIEVDCDSAFRVNAVNVDRQVIQSGKFANIGFRAMISDSQLLRLSKHSSSNTSGASGRFEFDCKVRRFSRDVVALRGIHLTRLNVNMRQP